MLLLIGEFNLCKEPAVALDIVDRTAYIWRPEAIAPSS